MEKDIDLVIWDLETSGFCPPEDKILEIGCVIVKGDVAIQRRWVLNNGIDISEKITSINGFTKEICEKDGEDPKEVLMQFLPIFKQCKRNVTHNGMKFDIPFLVDFAAHLLQWSEEQRDTVFSLLNSTAFDTAVGYRAHKLGFVRDEDEDYIRFCGRVSRSFFGKYNLGFCCDAMQINREGITAHRALGDVDLTHRLYKELNK